MSTRCNVLIGDRQFYHHNDGYPDGVGADLAYWLSHCGGESQVSADIVEDWMAHYLGQGIPSLIGVSWVDQSYEREDANGLHWDIEYLYLIKVDGPPHFKPHLYCVDVNRYLEENPMKGQKNVWLGRERHPFFGYKPSTYRKMFCRPEYEMPLPSTEVPRDERVYFMAAMMGRKDAINRGLDPDDDTPYGAYAGHGFFRVRNAKHKTVPKNAYRSGLYAARRYRP